MTINKRELQSPSGFPDLSPGQAIQQNRMLEIIRKNYELAGFVPLETPLIERTSILTLKAGGEIRNQIYGLRLLNPSSEAMNDTKDLGLRFDHTVPLARYVSANIGEINFPFRRYVIGPVFRGERPKDGRYRQFIQADIDVIGNETLGLFNDAEVVSVLVGIFKELNIGDFTVRLGHRKILKGLFESIGINSSEDQSKASNIIDRLEKVGESKIVELFSEIGVSAEQAKNLLTLLTSNASIDDKLGSLRSQDLNPTFNEGVKELDQIVSDIRNLGVDDGFFTIDLSIARGLEYYTGIVYETRFDAYPDLGSIASGGRYENLNESFSNKPMPGVGISIGVSRLLLRLIKVGLLSDKVSTVAKVLVATPEKFSENSKKYLKFAQVLRSRGIATEIFSLDRNLGKQMQFANRRGFSIVVIAKKENFEKNTVAIRNMITGDQYEVSADYLEDNVVVELNKI